MNGHHLLRVCVFLLLTGSVRADAPPSTIPTTAPVSAADFQQMYARALGPLYQPEDIARLLAAHRLIESFFSEPDSRRQTIADINASGVDPNVLGRIARLHLTWPTLAAGVYYINERVGPNDAVYFLGVPKGYDRTVAWPLVMKLPTASAFVGEPRPDPDQVAQIYVRWIEDELAQHPDALVVMPLLDLDQQYGPTPQGMNRAIVPLQHVTELVNVDPARVYMVGYSMSAYAVWDLALHEPTYFAAFNSLAGNAGGDWERLRLMDLRNVLPVVWHDSDDEVVPINAARSIVAALRSLKCDVEYEETKNVGHTPNELIVHREYDKMRTRVRELYPKRVSLQSTRTEPMYNRSDWVRIDQPMRPGKEHRLMLRNGGGKLTVYGNSFKVDATISKPGRVDVVTDNVESFRLYFNDQMIDFAKPLSVFVNGKSRFEGTLKPDAGEMLADQLFLGRGWRYFTAHVDIDFGEPTTRPATRATSRPVLRATTPGN